MCRLRLVFVVLLGGAVLSDGGIALADARDARRSASFRNPGATPRLAGARALVPRLHSVRPSRLRPVVPRSSSPQSLSRLKRRSTRKQRTASGERTGRRIEPPRARQQNTRAVRVWTCERGSRDDLFRWRIGGHSLAGMALPCTGRRSVLGAHWTRHWTSYVR